MCSTQLCRQTCGEATHTSSHLTALAPGAGLMTCPMVEVMRRRQQRNESSQEHWANVVSVVFQGSPGGYPTILPEDPEQQAPLVRASFHLCFSNTHACRHARSTSVPKLNLHLLLAYCCVIYMCVGHGQ